MISNRASFHDAARFQVACAFCGAIGRAFEAHHVIKRQRLRRRGLPEWDTRGAVRLCEGLGTNGCHHAIEKGRDRLDTARLPQAAICYVWECLGLAGYNMLAAAYTPAESRFTIHEVGECPHCQQPPR